MKKFVFIAAVLGFTNVFVAMTQQKNSPIPLHNNGIETFTVYYSVLGSPEQVEKDKAIIEKNTGKVRFEIGKRIRLRVTPEIKFIYSDGLEQGSRVLDLIEKISRGEIK